jgi:hypothetical protein
MRRPSREITGPLRLRPDYGLGRQRQLASPHSRWLRAVDHLLHGCGLAAGDGGTAASARRAVRRGERSISTSRAQVTVVDLHNLPDRAQRFVVGVTLRGEFARKERQGTARPLYAAVETVLGPNPVAQTKPVARVHRSSALRPSPPSAQVIIRRRLCSVVHRPSGVGAPTH